MNKTVVDIAKLHLSCSSCALSQLCLPATLGHDDLLRLESIVATHRPLNAKQELFTFGAPFRNLYVVRSGSLKTVIYGSDGSELVLGFHIPGDLLGFDGVSTNFHQCAAIALERTSLCMLPFNMLEDIARQVPDLRRQLWRLVSREFLDDQEHLVTFGRKQGYERLAIFLKSLSDRRRAVKKDPMRLELSMTRSDIASYLGLVLETASRLFGRFRDEGIVEVADRHTVHILDYDALKHIAEGFEGDSSEQRRWSG